jgi:glycosyltransferase involved in cell wall biosynthesis
MLTVESSVRPWTKVLVVITEDWFALSHFIPLLAELRASAGRVVVATRPSGRFAELEALGVETRAFDMLRGSLRVGELKAVREELAQLIDAERPDAIHAIAMQPMVMTSLALARSGYRPAAMIMHLTGRGYLGYARTPLAHLLRTFAHAALRRCTATHNAWLVGENSDDVAEMVATRVAVPERTAILPGAGVDPARYPQLAVPHNPVPRAAYVGRMIRSKGVHVLIEAQRLLRARAVPLEIDLYGDADPGSREAIPEEQLGQWSKEPGITWHGRTADVVGVWRRPISRRTGAWWRRMPRAMLEAALPADRRPTSRLPASSRRRRRSARAARRCRRTGGCARHPDCRPAAPAQCRSRRAPQGRQGVHRDRRARQDARALSRSASRHRPAGPAGLTP